MSKLIMEICNYEEVNNHIDGGIEKTETKWKPFSRQLLICSGVWVIYFVDGLVTGLPTVVIPQIRREANSTAAISDEMASWLSSILGLGGLPWVFILPALNTLVGRKKSYMIVCLNTLVGIAVFCLSVTVTHILISEIILGMLLTAVHTILPIIVSEYTSPQYRGVFLTIKSATFSWGIWTSNAIGTFFYYKNIGLVALGCCIYTLSVFFWPESPIWLASEGRFEECARSHRWLKGTDKHSEKELKDLINSQKVYDNTSSRKKTFISCNCIQSYTELFLSKEFYTPLLISMSLYSLYHFSGKLTYSIYVIEIVKKISGDESSAYKTMLILDGASVLGMYVGSGLSKCLKRRLQLLLFSCLGIMFLLSIAFYLYLIQLKVLTENEIVTITLLTLFSLSLSCGPIILCSSIYGEIISLKFRSFFVIIASLYANILYTFILKTAPYVFKYSLPGIFLLSALATSFFTLILYKYLPETKDKTLQEIQDYFKDQTNSHVEAKELMGLKIKNVAEQRLTTD